MELQEDQHLWTYRRINIYGIAFQIHRGTIKQTLHDQECAKNIFVFLINYQNCNMSELYMNTLENARTLRRLFWKNIDRNKIYRSSVREK